MNPIAQMIARHPRFDVVDDSTISVVSEIDVEGILERLECTLVNLSRHGARLEIPADLEEGDHFVLEIKSLKCDLLIRERARVQWAEKSISNGHCIVGSKLEGDISWETMGELFLLDAISPNEHD